MQQPKDLARRFVIIGENIHTTRVVLRKGARVTEDADGKEQVIFRDESGKVRHLLVPESYRETQPYQQGQIKHYLIAVNKGLSDDPAERAEGRAYVHHGVRRQVEAGAHFLDLNVDEVSYRLETQKQAMQWLVSTVQEVSPLPPSVDSSHVEIIEVGLASYDGRAGRPLINSVALERPETLDLIGRYPAGAVLTAAGVDSMPASAQDRVANVRQLVDLALQREMPLEDIYIDALVFPISVSSEHGRHYLDAVRELRELYGPKVHITGGLSNVSFGLPGRKIINLAFLRLALEAGVDSGILDPLQCSVEEAVGLDPSSRAFRLARDVLLGEDEFCLAYIQAWRSGELQ